LLSSIWAWASKWAWAWAWAWARQTPDPRDAMMHVKGVEKPEGPRLAPPTLAINNYCEQ